MDKFQLVSKFKPAGDQPKAITKLTKNLKNGVKNQVLLGVTGSGKTFTVASVIEKIQKPVLVISHNKTLCAQLYQEFKDFFPNNAVHYFVSYYDYYQPEAYIPQTNTYIEKDSKINEQIDRLRHATVQDMTTRKDIIVCASVSCIYNLGDPKNYKNASFIIKTGQNIKRKDFILHLTDLQYQRQDDNLEPSCFRVRGDIIEINCSDGNKIIKIEFNGDLISRISIKDTLDSKNKGTTINEQLINPADFWVIPQDKLKIAITNIRAELEERLKVLKKNNKIEEAQRLAEKTNYDLEMLQEVGYCHGVENYSSHLEFRKPGQAPFTLVDYFNYFYNNNFLILIDESHMTLPQLKAMSVQDRIRKKTLIDYGFRLPSAIDNRPLTFKESEERMGKIIYISATPSSYEKEKSGKKNTVEQIIRPTGLLEPSIEIKPTKNQINNLITEIKGAVLKKQRVLVLTITKKLAEAVSEYLNEQGLKTQYLHSEIKTLDRPEILKDFRLGKYDVLVGINLLREGLDLPEVSLVAILDADKEGFLRNATTLIQTMGRAARHLEGRVILYADKTTLSMELAIREINRRRKIQAEYNKKHKIKPAQIIKAIKNWEFGRKEKEVEDEFWLIRDKKLLEREMKKAAQDLNFERAAEIRDLIKKLK